MSYFTTKELNYHKKFIPTEVDVFIPQIIPRYNYGNTKNFLFRGYQLKPNGKIVKRCTCTAECPVNQLCMGGVCELDWTLKNPL